MLDRYGRQVFSEFYFPWLEEVLAMEDAPLDEAASDLCSILAFRNAPKDPQAKTNLAPQDLGVGGDA